MKNRIIPVAILLLATLYGNFSCNRKFDVPPPFEEPGVTVNSSIMQLKTLHTAGAFEQVKEEIIICGIVTGEDKSGNLYKQIVIQDSTGGIVIRLDGSALYTSYPIGRRVFVKCKGLYLGDYNHLIQLGGGVDKTDAAKPELSPIAVNLQETCLLKGALNQPVKPRVVNPAQLTTQMMDSLQSVLVQMEHMEFAAGDTGKTFADTSKAVSAVNYVIRNCEGGSITLRNSSYASFAGVRLPAGNGAVTGIYTIYGSTRQLNIRDTGDIQLGNARCGGQVAVTVKHIAELRAMYKGMAVPLTDSKIKAVVISDRNAKNIADNHVVLQEGDSLAGILVHFSAAAAFDMGDELEIALTGVSLEEYQGTLQLSNVPPGSAVKTGKKIITPRVVTAAQLTDGVFFEQWESTLVKLQQVNASGGTNGTWQGTVMLGDGTGSFPLLTRAEAAFASAAYASSVISSVTGILSENNQQKQLAARNAADIIAGTTPPPPGNSIVLQTAPLVLHFDDIGNGLPAGVQVRTGAGKNSIGKEYSYTGSKAAWTAAAGGFRNFASATETLAGSDQSAQDKAGNRCLGIKQVGNTNAAFPNGDPGAAFVFVLENTSGKYNLQMDLLLQSLDSSAGRTSTWSVDYATGEQPVVFTTAAAAGTLTTGAKSFSSNPVHVDFGDVLDNKSDRIWIRIVTLAASSGSGSRPASAIDELRFSWK